MNTIALSYNLNRWENEHEVEFDSQLTIDALVKSIEKKHKCIPVECWNNMTEWLPKLIWARPNMVFNVAEGFRGAAREAFYPALFEQLDLPYTWPGPTELLITHNKGLTKKLLVGSNIGLPWSHVLKSDEDLALLKWEGLPFPLIVKLNSEGSSMWMDDKCIVKNWSELSSQVSRVSGRFNTNIIIEQYIPGRDVSMTFVEGLGSLGPVEYICPGSDIYDFRLKGIDNDQIDVVTPENISSQGMRILWETTNRIAKLLDINGYCRIDYRLGGDESLNFLEVNWQVSFHPIGAFVLAGKEQGLGFDDLVHHIIDYASKNPRRNSRSGLITV